MENNNSLRDFFNIERRTKYFIYVLTFLFLSSAAIFALLFIGNNSLNSRKQALIKESDYFSSLELQGKGIVVFDVINNSELFSKNPDEPLPLASLTKVLTAVISSEKLGDNQEIKITKENLGADGDSNLVVGDTWQAKDLRDFTLLTSSNDGALALAAATELKENQAGDPQELETQFIKDMNEKASAIGLSNSRFFNEHGLDKSENLSGAYGSARDMITLFEYALKNYPEVLEATRYKNLEFYSTEKKYPAENTNDSVDQIPNIIASKTGYTDLAGGNLVIAFDAGLNRPIIISILGSSQEGRFEDAVKLAYAAMKVINQKEE